MRNPAGLLPRRVSNSELPPKLVRAEEARTAPADLVAPAVVNRATRPVATRAAYRCRSIVLTIGDIAVDRSVTAIRITGGRTGGCGPGCGTKRESADAN